MYSGIRDIINRSRRYCFIVSHLANLLSMKKKKGVSRSPILWFYFYDRSNQGPLPREGLNIYRWKIGTGGYREGDTYITLSIFRVVFGIGVYIGVTPRPETLNLNLLYV